jgi:hypothetical protein
VLTLLAGPGVVCELAFGSWVLLQPERINAYAQAVIRTLLADEHQRGCLMEERVLKGDRAENPEIRSTKSQTNPNAPMPKSKTARTQMCSIRFRHSGFGHCFGFRDSNFGFHDASSVPRLTSDEERFVLLAKAADSSARSLILLPSRRLPSLATMNRRDFLKDASLGAAGLALTNPLRVLAAVQDAQPTKRGESSYPYRIAFGAWINDLRATPLPLENWPTPQLDDAALESAIRAMDVQASAGFNYLDVWGLFATYGWPTDIVSACPPERRRRIDQLPQAARQPGLRLVLGLGTYSWGYDQIIAADPAVRGKNPDGTPHAHAMCDAHPAGRHRDFEPAQHGELLPGRADRVSFSID